MTPSTAEGKGRGRWASGRVWHWLALVLALGWVALVRVPMVLNASNHLDSDLAVDGLTLLDAVNGHWRWHYPGTPHMGAMPVLLSWVQAKVWGVDPMTLVSGGVVAYLAVVAATFGLNLRAFGPAVAIWGLVPMAFASTGTLFLSSRITGGHLLTAAWHAGAFAIVAGCLRGGGVRGWTILGFWCGLGLFLDSMVAVTVVGLVVAGVVGWWGRGRADGREKARPFRHVAACLVAFLLATGLGIAPRFVGAWADPHDAYREQFEPVTRGDVLVGHAKILLLDCLPRLIAGHRLPGLQADPEPPASRGFRPIGFSWLAMGVTGVSLGLFAVAGVALVVDRDPDLAGRAVRWGLIVASAVVVAGFVVNRNIFNSDNYRYLVFLLVPWSSGFGLTMGRMASKRPWLAGLIVVGFGAMMTADTARWYARLGWVDDSGWPVRKQANDPAMTWLAAHPETGRIPRRLLGRLPAFVPARRQGPRRAVPEYPDRFPDDSRALPGGRPRTLIVRPGPVGPTYRARALAEGGREVYRADGLSIVDWPPTPGKSP